MNNKIGVIVNAHNEGPWLAAALESAVLNKISVASETRCETDIFLVLDTPDKETRRVAEDFQNDISIFETAFGDLSQARNYAVANIDSDFVAFLDGDDAWGEGWLAGCVETLDTNPELSADSILHPQFNWHFGRGLASGLVFEHISSLSPDFHPEVLAVQNYWSALSFASRSIYERFPFHKSDVDLKAHFEDWTFNIETWNAGLEHRVVHNTVHFIREKASGSMKKHAQNMGFTYGVAVDFNRKRMAHG